MTQEKATGKPTADAIFLSPRVVDETALNEFSSTLHQDISAAESAVRDLRLLLDDIQSIQSDLKKNTESHKGRLDLGAKLLKALDSRSADLQSSLDAFTRHATTLKELEQGADSLVADRLASFEQRLEESFSRATAKLHARTEERLALLDAALERIEQQAARHNSPTPSGPVIDTSEHKSLIRHLDDSRAAAEQASQELGQSLDGAIHFLTELRQQRDALDTEFESMLQRAERTLIKLENSTAALQSSNLPDTAPPSPQIPPELSELAEAFRSDLLQDLSKMAAAMNMIANRAETMLRPPDTPDGSPEIIIRMHDQQSDTSPRS